jgi:hypothetical protein
MIEKRVSSLLWTLLTGQLQSRLDTGLRNLLDGAVAKGLLSVPKRIDTSCLVIRSAQA